MPSCTCPAPAAAPRKGPQHPRSGRSFPPLALGRRWPRCRQRTKVSLSAGQVVSVSVSGPAVHSCCPCGPAELGGAPRRRGGSGTQRSRADGGLRGPLGPPWTFCASWSLLSAGPGFWARAGEPDFSGACRHHRPSEGWRERGRAFALPVGRVGEDDHGRRAGDRLRHRSVGRAGAGPVGAQ